MSLSQTAKAAGPFEAFLRPTRFCTAAHPLIVERARIVADGETSESKIAAALFEWVRDSLQYTVGNWNHRAWETVLAGEGTCSNKANVLVALLRAAGIPAGYRVMSVDATRYFGICVPSWVCQGFSKASVHVYVCAYLGGRWVKCDPSDDRLLCEGIGHLNPVSRLVEFDGENDAVMPFSPEHVHSDEGVFPSIDGLLSKDMKAHSAQVEVMNLALRYARLMGRAYADVPSIQAAFLEHVHTEWPDLLERFAASLGSTRDSWPVSAPPASTRRVSTHLRVVPRAL